MTREEAKEHIDQIRRNEFGFDEATGQPSLNPLIAKLRRALKQLARESLSTRTTTFSS